VNPRPDEALTRRLLAGDRDACVELVRLYHAPLYRWLVRLCGDVHLAEDLTQEAFAAAWANLRTFRGASSPSAWLHRIAYRKFLDHCRSRHSRKTVPLDLTPDQTDLNATEPLTDVLAGEQSARLEGAIAQLHGRDREVIVLHYLQRLSYDEMAHVLGEPAGTLKWRTSRALQRLRQRWHEEAPLIRPSER
jgi:RNA polymerase sigma-70 factor (ECF subfamily)